MNWLLPLLSLRDLVLNLDFMGLSALRFLVRIILIHLLLRRFQSQGLLERGLRLRWDFLDFRLILVLFVFWLLDPSISGFMLLWQRSVLASRGLVLRQS